MPHLTVQQNNRGFSLTELLIVVAMLTAIGGFVVVSLVRGGRSNDRSNSALDLANCIQKARLDSMRRDAKDIKQMAQVKIFNRRFYSIAFDGDGDGNLDVPLVKSMPENADSEIEGPFPKTFIFDSRGLTVDADGKLFAPQSVFVHNKAGFSAIKFDQGGKVVFAPVVNK
ncbi:MAG TPA: prepilin-type N-terminal cleavage/methylation domain-containing protein [Pyrinomonadaceae bacterium]|nr:prepilin-type N-terminal cleavage/methylation domain-containing protein [Pyrinomonadaceae bacterium]